MNTMRSLSRSAKIMSNNHCSCEDMVRSSVIISTPQLLLVILSIAMSRMPSFLQVLVQRADPAQTSITSNPSIVKPENLCGPCCV
jgi:hypothetical protein